MLHGFSDVDLGIIVPQHIANNSRILEITHDAVDGRACAGHLPATSGGAEVSHLPAGSTMLKLHAI